MTGIPTDHALRHLLDSLDALHRRPRDRSIPDPTLYANIERRLAAAVRRDRTGDTTRDGYPSGTLGGGGRSQTSSSTETHALSPAERDRHHELTARACLALEDAVANIQHLMSALNSIDDLTSDQGPAPRTCAACTGHRPLHGDQAVAHRGTVGDRLPRATDLCKACWRYVERAYPAGCHNAEPPTPDAIAWHDEHGYWRIRTAA